MMITDDSKNAECFSNGRYVGPAKKELHFGDIIASENEYAKGISSVWHYHENPHFSHILNGGSIEVGEYNTAYQTEGDSLFYNPCMLHKNTDYKENTRIFNLELQPGFFTKNKLKYSAADNYWSYYDEHLKKVLVIKVLKEYLLNDTNSGLSIEQLCVLLCQQDAVKQKPEKNNHWSSLLKEYLHEKWNTPFSLSELSEEVQIHPVNISKYFSRYFNCTLGEYIRRIKIEKSLPLIRNKKYSLTEIAYECGFTDQSHFTKTFRNITGMLPKDYRQF
ncbi:transcriptional regulator, AraC family [Chitinophaga sp. YR573]|uniref:AraC family transcriptional regulator n=1 Tax=Chitinophaga sp. YR573 TaxID=1881040 RepID=UPI0008B8E9E3|nr:AraC family transcriptional regulator [Chitinophaga sp. YR573]SEW00346.1 transcriptional regulator, AraC family [Chitinophaga sp. YR573]